MSSLIEKIARRILHKNQLRDQEAFQALLTLSLEGMGFGNGASTAFSGEEFLMSKLAQELCLSKSKYEDVLFFDVGANKGDYSAVILDKFKTKMPIRVFAFEPQSALIPELKARFDSNPEVRIMPFAFSDHIGEAEMFGSQHMSGLGSVYKRRLDHFNIDFSSTQRIKTTTLDAFIQEEKIDKIDFLKLDVEGHEFSVLKGAKQALADRKIHRLQFEFGGCNIDSRTYFQDFWYLLSQDFNIFRIVKDGLVRM